LYTYPEQGVCMEKSKIKQAEQLERLSKKLMKAAKELRQQAENDTMQTPEKDG